MSDLDESQQEAPQLVQQVPQPHQQVQMRHFSTPGSHPHPLTDTTPTCLNNINHSAGTVNCCYPPKLSAVEVTRRK